MSATPIVDPDVPFRGLTVPEYEALISTGALEDARLELLEGGLYEMAPQGPLHAGLANRLRRHLEAAWARAENEEFLVRLHSPVVAGGRSVPEPDVCVYDASADSLTAHPDFAHLVVEVADSSVGRDLVHKARIYASAGFPEYWVVDLPRREVVVHRDPRPELAQYASVQRLADHTPLTAVGVTVSLADLLD